MPLGLALAETLANRVLQIKATHHKQ